MMKTSYKVALGGIISSLSLLTMILGGIIPGLEYTVPAIAGMLLVIIVIEIGLRWAFLTYIGVALLTFFIVPNKESGLLFIAFLGYYPVLKSVLETKLKKRYLQWMSKLIVFNIALAVYYRLVMWLVAAPELAESVDELGRYALYILAAAANAVFIVYDIALTRIINTYLKWFRKKIARHINK